MHNQNSKSMKIRFYGKIICNDRNGDQIILKKKMSPKSLSNLMCRTAKLRNFPMSVDHYGEYNREGNVRGML